MVRYRRKKNRIEIKLERCSEHDILFKDLTRFKDSELFVYIVYVGNFMRDVVSLIIEIVLDIMLVFYFSHFVIEQARRTGRRDETLTLVERTNMSITFILSFLAILTHSLMFLVNLALILLDSFRSKFF